MGGLRVQSDALTPLPKSADGDDRFVDSDDRAGCLRPERMGGWRDRQCTRRLSALARHQDTHESPARSPSRPSAMMAFSVVK